MNSDSPNIRHDDTTCIESALARAEKLCHDRNLRLTELRRQVFTLIWQTQKPIGAYALMKQLQASSDRKQVAPPTIYRAIDFLIQHGLIHKVHSLNAYFGCPNPLREHHDALFICSNCGHTVEVPNNSIQHAINLSADQHNFQVEQQMLEISGRCHNCIQSENNIQNIVELERETHE